VVALIVVSIDGFSMSSSPIRLVSLSNHPENRLLPSNFISFPISHIPYPTTQSHLKILLPSTPTTQHPNPIIPPPLPSPSSSKPKHRRPTRHPIKHTRVIHRHILPRHNLNNLLRDHPARQRGNIMQLPLPRALQLFRHIPQPRAYLLDLGIFDGCVGG